MIDLEGLAGHRGSAFGWVGQQWEGKHVSLRIVLNLNLNPNPNPNPSPNPHQHSALSRCQYRLYMGSTARMPLMWRETS